MANILFRKRWSSFKIFWLFGNLTWLPLCFIHFDSLHDGIILATVNQLKMSLSVSGPWPFNQYGSAWVIPYLIVSYIVPSNFLLLSIRLVTIAFYIGASLYLYKSALIIFNLRVARVSVFLFIALQPFLGPWNNSLLPWPSSVVSLLLPVILFLLLKEIDSSRDRDFRYVIGIGLLCGFVAGSRIQIGILLITGILFFTIFSRPNKVKYLIFGFTSWLALWAILLMIKGWLLGALYDSVILASQFLGSDHLHYPVPFLSILGGILLFAVIELLDRIYLKTYYLVVLLFPLVITATIFSKSVLGNSWGLANLVSVLQRKTLAAVFFAAILFLVIELILLARERLLYGGRVNDQNLRIIALYIISLCSAFQAWPFFDQMHIWWSISPLIIVFAAKVSTLEKLLGLKSLKILMIIASLLMGYLVSSQFVQIKSELKSINQKLIFVEKSTEEVELSVQKFLDRNLSPGSEILNLCPNAYPFFRIGEFKSSSRYFVYWSNFASAPFEYADYSPSKIENVLVCETYLYQDFELQKYRSRQEAILKTIPNLILVDNFEKGSFRWKIYSNKLEVK